MSLDDGLTAFKRGRYVEAIALLETYCQSCREATSIGSRNYMQAGIALVKSYHAEKQFEKAIAQCEAFMASDKNPALKIWADKTFPKLHQAANQPEPEIESSAVPTSSPQRQDNIHLLDRGIAAQKRGENEKAIEALEAYLVTCSNTRSRNYMQAQMTRIKAYRALGKVDKAFSLCEELHASDNVALQSWASKAMIALRPSGETQAEKTHEVRVETNSANPSQPHSASAQSKKTAPQVPRRSPVRPGVARLLENTSTVEISATSSNKEDLSELLPTSQQSGAHSSSIPSSPAQVSSRTRKPTNASLTRANRTQTRSSQARGAGTAALLGGGAMVVITRLLFRRGLIAVIAFFIWAARTCLGGDYAGTQSYSTNDYSDYSYNELHQAACEGNTEEAQTLIQNGIQVDVLDTDGNTPLFWAVAGCSSVDEVYPVTEGHQAVATLLLNSGASTSVTNIYGETPLHWAAAWGTADITLSLIGQGANINALDEYQSTPLHWAAWGGNQPSTETLVNLGVSLNPQNLDGDTPLDLAHYYSESRAVATFLQSKGALAKNTAQ